MDLTEKVTEALRQSLQPDQIHLKDENGVYGHVVSSRFSRMPALERQLLILSALRDSSVKFTKGELRQIALIVALTPAEHKERDCEEDEKHR